MRRSTPRHIPLTRLPTETNALGKSRTYRYDANGNQIEMSDRDSLQCDCAVHQNAPISLEYVCSSIERAFLEGGTVNWGGYLIHNPGAGG
jgi:YD repeat-containing protein